MSIYNIVPRLPCESETVYMFRIDYIEGKYNIISSDIRNLIKQSKIFANIKFKKCHYDIKI